MKRRVVGSWILTGLLVGFCSGCGPVNIKTMAPRVWKPSALFVLDENFPNWLQSSTVALGDRSSVVTKAVYVSSDQLQTTLNRTLHLTPDVSLFVVVSNQGLTESTALWARQHITKRLEWVSPSSGLDDSLLNVRQLAQNPTNVGYLVGWIAAHLAATMGTTSIGWDLAPSGAPKSAVLASFGGAYAASPAMRPISQSLNEFAANSVSNTSIQLPKVIITNHGLTASALNLVRSSQSLVFSLVSQAGDLSQVAVQPAVPTPDLVLSDLLAFKDAAWKSGVRYVSSPNPITVNTGWVTPSDASALKTQEGLVQSDGTFAASAWNFVPAAIRQSWGNIVTP